jgi:hypothetical protein
MRRGGAGVAEVRAALALQSAVGALIAWPYFLALLANATRRTRKIAEALASVAEGLDVAQNSGDYLYEPKLQRLKGSSYC